MKRIIGGSLVFLFSFIVGLSRLAPTISSGDSGELAGAGATLGIAHSPGYPLYCLLGKVFVSVLPFGNPAYRMNLMSFIFGSLTVVLIYLIVLNLTGMILPAVCSALTLSFTYQFWLLSLTSEVFTLNCFFASLLIFVLLTNSPINQFTNYCFLYLFSFLFGLGLGNHHTLILTIPGFTYLIYRKLKTENGLPSLTRSPAYLLLTFFFFLLGLSVYLYVPIRSLRQPLFDWEDPQTWERFWGLVRRARYGTLQLAQGGVPGLNLTSIFNGLFFFVQILKEAFTFPGVILLLLGTIFLLKERLWNEIIFFFLLLFFGGPFFLSLSGVTSLSPGIKYILERFMTLSLVPAGIILGFTFSYPYSFSNYPSRRIIGMGILGAFFFLPLFLFLNNSPRVSQRDNFLFFDYGKNILRSTSSNAVILSDRADETEFSLAYLLNTEARRKDLRFIDCNAGVSRSIYGDDYYRVWGKPRLARREIVEKELIEKTSRAGQEVYYSTVLPEQTAIPKYQHGLLYIVKRDKERVFPKDMFFLRRPQNWDIRAENLFYSHLNLLGKYYLYRGESSQAKIFFDGLKVFGEKKDWVLTVAYLCHQKGYIDEAQKEYEEALEIDPNWTEVLCNLGAIYEQKGNLPEATKLYERAIAANPNYTQAYYNLGVIYWRKGEWAKVVDCFEKVLQLEPEHPEVKKYLPQARLKSKENK